MKPGTAYMREWRARNREKNDALGHYGVCPHGTTLRLVVGEP